MLLIGYESIVPLSKSLSLSHSPTCSRRRRGRRRAVNDERTTSFGHAPRPLDRRGIAATMRAGDKNPVGQECVTHRERESQRTDNVASLKPRSLAKACKKNLPLEGRRASPKLLIPTETV